MFRGVENPFQRPKVFDQLKKSIGQKFKRTNVTSSDTTDEDQLYLEGTWVSHNVCRYQK